MTVRVGWLLALVDHPWTIETGSESEGDFRSAAGSGTTSDRFRRIRTRPARRGKRRTRPQAIRTAVRHIGEHDPDLGEHLSKAVRTDTLCTTSQAPAIRWTVTAAPSRTSHTAPWTPATRSCATSRAAVNSTSYPCGRALLSSVAVGKTPGAPAGSLVRVGSETAISSVAHRRSIASACTAPLTCTSAGVLRVYRTGLSDSHVENQHCRPGLLALVPSKRLGHRVETPALVRAMDLWCVA
jgi:hypothetical protein